MVVCNNVTKVNVSNAGHDNTTVTLPSPLPETLDIGMNCTGIMIVTLSQKDKRDSNIYTFSNENKFSDIYTFTEHEKVFK